MFRLLQTDYELPIMHVGVYLSAQNILWASQNRIITNLQSHREILNVREAFKGFKTCISIVPYVLKLIDSLKTCIDFYTKN